MCQELQHLTHQKKDAQQKFDEAMTATRGLTQEEFSTALERLQKSKEELNGATRAMEDHKAEHRCRETEVKVRFVAHLGV
jgi:hypothetical protein